MKKLMSYTGWMVLALLILLIITLVVLRFRPDAAVWAANLLLEDTHIEAETIQLGYFPPKFEASKAMVTLPDQNISVTALAANMDLTAWRTNSAYWSLTADKVTIDVTSDRSQSPQSSDTPINLAIPDLAPLLSFTQLGVNELEMTGDSPLKATLLADRRNAETHIEASVNQGSERYSLTGSIGHSSSGSMPFKFHLSGAPADQDSTAPESATPESVKIDVQLQGSLNQQAATSLVIDQGVALLTSGEDLSKMHNINGLVELSQVGDTIELNNLRALISSSAADVTDIPAELNAKVSLGKDQLSVTGNGSFDKTQLELQINAANATGDLNGRIDLASDGLPEGFDLAPFTNKQLFPASFVSGFRLVDNEFSLQELKLNTPRNALNGSASISTAAPWRLIADLNSPRLFLPLVSDAPEAEAPITKEAAIESPAIESPAVASPANDSSAVATDEPASELIFSADPIDWSWLTSADIDAKLVAVELALQDARFTDLKISMQNNNGRLTLDPLSASLGEGGFSGRANVDLQPAEVSLAPIKLTAGFEMFGVSLEAFGLVPTEELSGGKVEADIKLSALGNSQSELASSLDGEILLMVEDAVLMNDFIEVVGSDLVTETLNKLNPFTKEDPTTQLSCALVRFTAEDGKLSTKNQLVMETSKMEIVGNGSINLNDEKISLGITPNAKSGVGINIGSAVKFLKLGGTLAAPRPAVSAGGLLKSGLAIGAAISTGGASVVAEGLAKRALNAGSACEAVRSETSDES